MVSKVHTSNGIGIIEEPKHSGHAVIEQYKPYEVDVTIQGTADLLFNRYDPDEAEAKSAAKKGSAMKNVDIPENKVYRDEHGNVCLPGLQLVASIAAAAKYKSDPRSPRASAMKLYKSGVYAVTELAPIKSATGETCKEGWDYLDRRGVVITRRVTRLRPAFFKGWKATVRLTVHLPEYITPDELLSTINDAGRYNGVGDFRPTYGRFQVTGFEVVAD